MEVKPAFPGLPPVVLGAVGLVTIITACTVTVGADTMWLVALGKWIASQRSIPVGLPFISVDTATWINVPVLGELALAGLNALGPWGLVTAQVLAVSATLWLVALSSLRLGSGCRETALALMFLAIGALSTLAVARAQIWSLFLYTALTLVLRHEHQHPSRRVWLLVPIVALWGNLHGAVLVGVAVAGCYLLLSRIRVDRRTGLGVTATMVLALWATPGGLRTHQYYLGVLTNEAARRGEGLWARVSPDSILDVLFLIGGAALVVAAISRRLPLWEYVAAAGLLVMAAQAARNGTWLLLFLMPRSAWGATRERRDRPAWNQARAKGVSRFVLAVTITIAVIGLAPRAGRVAQQASIAERVATVIGQDRSTLAPSPLAESLAVAGVSLWASNPIDALPRARQQAYLDFLRTARILPSAKLPAPDVIVLQQAPSTVIDAPVGYDLAAEVEGYLILLKRTSSSTSL